MSHFYATIQGNRGEGSRCTKKQGIHGHIRGWRVGAEVECLYSEISGRDIVIIEKTSGSNGRNREIIAEYCDKQGEFTKDLCPRCLSKTKCFKEKVLARTVEAGHAKD